jgi:predicted DNA-binding transcriptional regulator YafY
MKRAKRTKAKINSSVNRVAGESRPDERVLQLLLMLIDAGRPVSRAEIFEAIGAYRTRTPAAGERKFERDKKELRELGVPIEEPEEEPNTYQVRRRAYELPELHLEEDERAALALAAEALASWEGLAYRDLVEEALRKLSYATGLSGPAKTPRHLAVTLPHRGRGRRLRKSVDELTRAVDARKRVTLTYQSSGGDTTERDVDPYGLVYSGGDWQLVGHCHLRAAPRTFRVDRIERLRVAGKPGSPDFDRPVGWNLSSYVQRSPWVFLAGASGTMEVTLDIGPDRAWMADEDFGANAVREILPPEAGGEAWTRVKFRSGNPNYIVTRVLDAVGSMRVVLPKELRERIRQTATAVASLYDASGVAS